MRLLGGDGGVDDSARIALHLLQLGFVQHVDVGDEDQAVRIIQIFSPHDGAHFSAVRREIGDDLVGGITPRLHIFGQKFPHHAVRKDQRRGERALCGMAESDLVALVQPAPFRFGDGIRQADEEALYRAFRALFGNIKRRSERVNFPFVRHRAVTDDGALLRRILGIVDGERFQPGRVRRIR